MNELISVPALLRPYNPVGNILIGITAPAYQGYAERVYNIEGIRQAALAAIKLRTNGVSMNQVNSALSQSDLRNPYDEKPFVWDSETSSIVFNGLGQEERNTYYLLY